MSKQEQTWEVQVQQLIYGQLFSIHSEAYPHPAKLHYRAF